MALTATVYHFDTEIADVDRGVYETLALRVALQPSETPEYMVARFLAYCLEYAPGIEMTEGVAAGDEPAILVRDLTGRVTAWIEVGNPSPARLHRGMKLAGRAAVYTHRPVALVLSDLDGKGVHRAPEIPVFDFGRGFVEKLCALIERRTRVSLSRTEGQLYLDIGGQSLSTPLGEHHFG